MDRLFWPQAATFHIHRQIIEMTTHSLPILGFVGPSGSGKTTLLEQVIGHLADTGIRLAVLKHAKPGFDLDQNPGKDSFRLRSAGADQVLIASRDRWALMARQADPLQEPVLGEMLRHLDASALDGVLVEGFNGNTLEITFDSLVSAIRAGNAYVNVHTDDGDDTPNTGAGDMVSGEIRGQITPQ